MLPCLDIAPRDWDFARTMASEGHFVFIINGDPAVVPVLREGMAYIRKDLVPRKAQGINEYVIDGRIHLVRAVDFEGLMRDIGVERFEVIRCSNRALMDELPGPIAKRIIFNGRKEESIGHLKTWYGMDRMGGYTLRERP